MKHNLREEIGKVLDAVYIHGTHKGMDVAVTDDSMTIADGVNQLLSLFKKRLPKKLQTGTKEAKGWDACVDEMRENLK